MPFTLSHGAAALPFLRGPLLPAAVVAGSFVPDLPLFVDLTPRYLATHSVTGIVTWDVVLTLLALAAWYGVLREPVLALAPRWVRARVPPTRRWRPSDALWIPVSAALGAATHVFWDTFTHRRALSVWGWDWLGTAVLGVPAYQVLQYASSIAGLVIMLWWAARRPVVAAEPKPAVANPGRIAVVAAALVVGLGSAFVYGLGLAPHGLRAAAYGAVVGCMIGSAFVIGGYSAAWRIRMALSG